MVSWGHLVRVVVYTGGILTGDIMPEGHYVRDSLLVGLATMVMFTSPLLRKRCHVHGLI